MAYNNANQEVKDFTNNRFMFSLTINDRDSELVDPVTNQKVNEFIICQRYFNVFNFIEGSMQSMEFFRTIESIVNDIKEELKMETLIWMSYNWTGSQPRSFGRSFKDYDKIVWNLGEKECILNIGKDEPDQQWYDTNVILDDELKSSLADDGRYTFKFTVYDNTRPANRKEVISRIFDGRYYPALIRNNVDLTSSSRNTDSYGLRDEAYIKAQINKNKKELISGIMNKIYTTCSLYSKNSTDENAGRKIARIINEKYLNKSTGSRNIYFNKKEEFLAKKEKKASDNTNTETV